MGKVYVAFTDSREATKAIEKVKVLRPEWHISTIAPKEYVKHVEPSLLPQTSNYEVSDIVSASVGYAFINFEDVSLSQRPRQPLLTDPQPIDIIDVSIVLVLFIEITDFM
ncbi:meiosis protein MEI2 [Aspergillus luchuensis]|uniref:Meiosis protein MEI2 n=1 Tax=Aspergillus kawachii TaxID=1069201 RepID=A0A146FYP8_ASPKA|nr:meiosis protein MEI2 [Aspergillus luchuensis]